ncbi:MAG: hypothetical protein JWQ97_2447 [Phenylobacterium sp.]|nr:hypothetical protein [Phenylobacterium sp.]
MSPSAHEPPPEPPSPRSRLIRFAPLAILAAIAAVAWWAGLPHALSPAELGHRQAELRDSAAEAPVLAVGLFVLAYAVLTGACLPVALMLSLVGGLVFGPWIGGAAVLVGATGGAMLTYAATRSAFAHVLVARAERDPRLQRIMQGFGRNAFSYIVTLRLIPFFPFPLVNIASGLAAVPLRPYALGTFLGGAPTALIYASLGAGLGASLGSERSLAEAVRAPGVILPLAALTALSLIPMLFRRVRRRLAP